MTLEQAIFFRDCVAPFQAWYERGPDSWQRKQYAEMSALVEKLEKEQGKNID